MRARNIKPGFFKNDLLAELSPMERLFFIGLWCYADREGRFEVREKRLKAEIAPYDDLDPATALENLQAKGFVHLYTHGDTMLCQITKFGKHQNPHKNEKPSTLPGVEEAPYKYGASTVQAPEQHQSNRADSGFLIPDPGYLIPDTPPTPQGSVSAKKNKPKKAESEQFKLFYSAYPNKKKRPDAFKAWGQVDGDTLAPEIMAGLDKALKSAEWAKEGGQYIPYPASWLRGRCWEDSYTPVQNKLGAWGRK